MTLSGWKNVQLEALFENRKERGLQGLPTISVTIGDGLIDRDQLDRKTDTTLEANEHLLVEPNDIVYNTMRMWQGASGLVTKRAIVSPAYVVAKPLPTIDAHFASYLFKTPRMIHLFWAYSHGLTDDRRRLYFDDFADIPTIVPPVVEQRRIAEILSTWDRAIEATEKLIANSQAQKKALMQQLLTGKKRLPGFSGEWRTTTLGTLGEFIKGTGISRSDLLEHGLPAVRYGEIYTLHHYIIESFGSFISREVAVQSTRLVVGDIVFTCSGETAEEIGKCVAYLSTEEAYAGGDTIILRNHQQSPEFLGYALNSEPVCIQKAKLGQGNSVVHISARNLASVAVNLPPPDEQRAIASILCDMRRGIARLQSKLAVLRTEKAALMQQLLTGKRRVKLSSAQEEAA